MELSTLRIGARIAFYEVLNDTDGPRDYVGAAGCEDAFAAVAVPRVGELVSVVSLTGDTHSGSLLHPWAAGPFLKVVTVEHDPVAMRGGERPAWWEPGWTDPGVRIVFHAHGPNDIEAGRRLIHHFQERGWAVNAHSGVFEQAFRSLA
ncbi:MAG: hypothetical protein ACRDRY_18905 [Pseudonocardiaceae bacterium]